MPYSEMLQWAENTQQLVMALATINNTLKTMHKDIVVSLEMLQKEVNSVKEEVSEVKKEVSEVKEQVIITNLDINERLDPIAYSAVEVNKSTPCRLRSFCVKPCTEECYRGSRIQHRTRISSLQGL